MIAPDSYEPEEAGAVSPLDRDPAIFISTFKSYEEMGLAYGRAASPKAAITPEIAALANEITKDIADKHGQAIAIDGWVKKNIRYVAVVLSLGRVVPHDAAAVFRNKFGDCKDMVTLTGYFDLGNAGETKDPVTIRGSFTLNERFRPPPSGVPVVIPYGMPLMARPGNFLLGSRLSGRKSPFVCYAGRQTEDIDATFDPALPIPIPLADLTIENSVLSYRSTFKVEGRTLKMHREFI